MMNEYQEQADSAFNRACINLQEYTQYCDLELNDARRQQIKAIVHDLIECAVQSCKADLYNTLKKDMEKI